MQLPALTKRRSQNSIVRSDTAANNHRDTKISIISVDLISPNRFQPRKSFDSVSLLRLCRLHKEIRNSSAHNRANHKSG